MPISDESLSVCIICKAWCCTQVRPPITEEEKNEIISAGFPDYFEKIKEGVYEIKSSERGVCPYLLDNFSCSIQQVKPKLCKAWPVIPRFKNNIRDYIVVKCPLTKGLSKEELANAKKDAEQINDEIVRYLGSISTKKKDNYKRFKYEKI